MLVHQVANLQIILIQHIFLDKLDDDTYLISTTMYLKITATIENENVEMVDF